LKFNNIQRIRELLEILYMVPPLYHLNRESWTQRRSRILRHLAFWGPLHRQLASSALTHFEYLTSDRLVQRTKFQTERGVVTITVNFGAQHKNTYPAFSAVVSGPIETSQKIYLAAN
jgi:hypothetical protein